MQFGKPLVIVACGFFACGEGDDGENPCGVAPAGTYQLGATAAGCLSGKADVHVYKIRSPGDPNGGYVQASAMGAATEKVRLIAYDATGKLELGQFVQANAGVAATFFLAVAPGQDYRIAVAHEGDFNAPYSFQFTTTYTPVADSFEPNDTIVMAKTITMGVPVHAYMFAGRPGAPDGSGVYDDYYRFGFSSGSITIKIEDVAPDLAPRLFLYQADGMEAARVSSGIKGGSLVLLSPMPPGGGELFVRVAPWSDAPQSIGPGPALPEHFTRPYKLSVTQP